MKRKAYISSVLLCLMLLVAIPVRAQEEGSGYLIIKAGAVYPDMSRKENISDYEADMDFQVGAGVRAGRNVAAEFLLGYTKVDGSGDGQCERNGNIYQCEQKDEMYIIPLTATIKAVFPVDLEEIVEPYFGGGLGIYVVGSDLTTEIPALQREDLSSSDEVAFGYHLVGGVNFRITPTMNMGLDLKWFYVRPRFSYDEGEYKQRLSGLSLYLSLAFSF